MTRDVEYHIEGVRRKNKNHGLWAGAGGLGCDYAERWACVRLGRLHGWPNLSTGESEEGGEGGGGERWLVADLDLKSAPVRLEGSMPRSPRLRRRGGGIRASLASLDDLQGGLSWVLIATRVPSHWLRWGDQCSQLGRPMFPFLGATHVPGHWLFQGRSMLPFIGSTRGDWWVTCQ